MAEAVDAITSTVRAGGTILVHGDYDVDGQCATALLTRALRAAGADVVGFVPHRLRDGYDFGPAGLAAAQRLGASLVVTCDCGITAVDAVRDARATGIGVVVTDHHLPGPELPPALAVVDPQRDDDTSTARVLCGTGIAFKLVQALVPALGLPPNLPYHLLDLVALATVADVVPLLGENRILVRHGLRLLAESRWPGLRALVEAAGLAGRELRAGHMGYMLGPRLNAVGRIGDAADGLRLLLTDDPDEAIALARRLEGLNVERQSLDQRILEEALEQVEQAGDPERDAGFVLAGDGWHPGVVGIVASRVVERYGRPAFLIAFDGDVGKGSGRSISRFDLHAALLACGDLLERYGGHQMAAGLTIRRDRLDEFRERFGGIAREALGPDDLGPEQRVDLEIGLAEATPSLERMAATWSRAGRAIRARYSASGGCASPAGRAWVTGTSRACSTTATTRLAAIGFQWADRVPWLADGLVDAAFRLEPTSGTGTLGCRRGCARCRRTGWGEGGRSGRRVVGDRNALPYRRTRRAVVACPGTACPPARPLPLPAGPSDEHRRRRVRRPPARDAEGRPGPAHRGPGARGVDEHPRPRCSRGPRARPLRRAAARWGSRRCRAGRARPRSWSSTRRRSRRSRPTSRRSAWATASSCTGATRCGSPSGCGRARTTLALADPPYSRDDAARLVALFRRTPFARILSVEHRADEQLDGRRHPPLRRYRPHLLPRSMTRIAIYPGSFDPPTKGHEDLIRRSLALADRVVVAVAVNPSKQPLFPVAERLAMLAGHGAATSRGSRSSRSKGCWRSSPRRSAPPWWCAASARSATSSTSSRWR